MNETDDHTLHEARLVSISIERLVFEEENDVENIRIKYRYSVSWT